MRLIGFVIYMVVLAVTGIGFAIAGAIIGGRVLGADSVGFGSLGLAIGGILIGYPLGTIAGLLLLKRVFHLSGSIWLGIVGAILGTVGTAALAEPLNLNSSVNLLFGVFILLVPGLTLAGFRLGKRRG